MFWALMRSITTIETPGGITNLLETVNHQRNGQVKGDCCIYQHGVVVNSSVSGHVASVWYNLSEPYIQYSCCYR